MRRLAIADQTRDIRDGDRALLLQQIGSGGHSPREEVLAKRHLAELGVRALKLAGRARQGASHDIERELPAVVARDQDPREQIQPATS